MVESLQKTDGLSKIQLYNLLKRQILSLFEYEHDFIANTANFSSILYHTLPDVNWAGFYFLKNSELVLGPFQGNPACVRIQLGLGVCGTAAVKQSSLIVPNVHEFQGHIVCDSASNSEIVIPLVKNGILLGVLDIDSPVLDRFDETDRTELEFLTSILLQFSEV